MQKTTGRNKCAKVRLGNPGSLDLVHDMRYVAPHLHQRDGALKSPRIMPPHPLLLLASYLSEKNHGDPGPVAAVFSQRGAFFFVGGGGSHKKARRPRTDRLPKNAI